MEVLLMAVKWREILGFTSENILGPPICNSTCVWAVEEVRERGGGSESLPLHHLQQGLANFFCKESEGHLVTVTTTQLCQCVEKAAIDNT